MRIVDYIIRINVTHIYKRYSIFIVSCVTVTFETRLRTMFIFSFVVINSHVSFNV